jgi:hypothetical protein
MGWRFWSNDWFGHDDRDSRDDVGDDVKEYLERKRREGNSGDGRDGDERSDVEQRWDSRDSYDSRDNRRVADWLKTQILNANKDRLVTDDEVRNRNCFSDSWFSDGAYFSENGMVIYKADGTPFCYLDDCTNTFHSYETGRMLFYYCPFGETLWPAKLPTKRA